MDNWFDRANSYNYYNDVELMNKKKRHHYIPKFYLKRFSNNTDGKFLSLYNINNKKFIHKAPIKSQAYENYLYGENDDIENALAVLEGKVARMFYYWTEERILYPPPKNTDAFKILMQFILYQAFRTPSSGIKVMKMLNEGLKAILKETYPHFAENEEDWTLVHENPVLLGFIKSIEHLHLLEFLDCKFLLNLSPLHFVTSDTPVIFYNQLLEQADNYVGATALVSKGLQVFYPIHPRLMICLYDPIVYDFGNECDGYYSTESVREVHQLNALQLANCESQLFFDELISEAYISELFKQFDEYRGTSKNINQCIDYDNRRALLIGSEEIRIGLNLNFFKLKVNPNDFKLQISPLRHPSFLR